MSGGTNMAVAGIYRQECVAGGCFHCGGLPAHGAGEHRPVQCYGQEQYGHVLAEQKFQSSGCTEQECAVEMGKLLNVKKMLVGSLSKLLDTYYIR